MITNKSDPASKMEEAASKRRNKFEAQSKVERDRQGVTRSTTSHKSILQLFAPSTVSRGTFCYSKGTKYEEKA